MIKAIFFDVDGTLISHTKKNVPKSTRNALASLFEKRILRVLATGRHTLELDLLPINDIRFDAYITLNGQLCLDQEGNVISGNPIVGQSKERIIQLFQEKNIPIMIVEKDDMYINFVNQSVEIAQKAISTPVPDIKEYSGHEIFQAIAFIEKGKEGLLQKQMPDCKVTRWNEHAVDIISASGGKRMGIIKFLEKMVFAKRKQWLLEMGKMILKCYNLFK